MKGEREIKKLAEEFVACKDIIMAVGDENRLHLMIEMMQMGNCSGVRVGDITEKTHLSRPAVSHHLQILKAAGILSVRKEGTKNYYYFNSDLTSMKRLIRALQMAVDIASELPDRSEMQGQNAEFAAAIE
ncbi:winged helix-turn-helix transcriptional regulator [Lachnospiraceae bacterium DSM 108991]|uniref:Winged helix-turn-helix transcriptional regulator n=1 Tax=Claveliimonas monacensis TaxID=2779351 RepID=A0ABR9RIV7_9FIRM|nr:metalloregulator ArsR/SmtB family transcription factor [Claveliimonas monacensis]MBE5062905.1 winged helix-turn-helix transcriptional regulator [Claveliimonas monacensis]